VSDDGIFDPFEEEDAESAEVNESENLENEKDYENDWLRRERSENGLHRGAGVSHW
jgi:hypothetical protein